MAGGSCPSASGDAWMDLPFIDGATITGRVVEVNTTSSFQSPRAKLAALFADGQPYTLGSQAFVTALFIEPVSAFDDPGAPGAQRCLLFMGDMRGAVAKGNIVQALVRESGGALYVRELLNLTTNSTVAPSFQVSREVALVLLLLTLLGGIALLASIGSSDIASIFWLVVLVILTVKAMQLMGRGVGCAMRSLSGLGLGLLVLLVLCLLFS